MSRGALWQRYVNFTLTKYIHRNKYSLFILASSLLFCFVVLCFTQGTINELAFILFGAPVLYSCLVYHMKVGTIVAFLASGAKVFDVVYSPDRLEALPLGQGLLEGIFIPLFYLFFCLLIGRLITNERELRESYRRLSEKLTQANQENIQLFTSTIQALAASIDAKDPYTRGHSERVTGYAVQIAKALGLSENQQQNILYGAILHDIGKIGVPGQILRKPGRLNSEEFIEIKQHPARGAAILGSIEALAKVIPLVYHHHEWYNGDGYPAGIAGSLIPLGARIIAVADAYDAMTSDRPYRPGMSKEKALQELCRFKGIQFDPRVVDAHVQITSEGTGLPQDCISNWYRQALSGG